MSDTEASSNIAEIALATIVAMDISEDSLAAAQESIRFAGFRNVVFQQADVYSMTFAPDAFDHVFACFVLEHL